jgi:prevent-host-death family protein
MDHIGIYDAKARLSQLVEEVMAGGEVVITKRGKPVARLVAPEAPHKSSPARAAKRIRALCERLNVRGINVRKLIEQGRD